MRLTDEKLQALKENAETCTVVHSHDVFWAAIELIALRERNAKLEAALRHIVDHGGGESERLAKDTLAPQ